MQLALIGLSIKIGVRTLIDIICLSIIFIRPQLLKRNVLIYIYKQKKKKKKTGLKILVESELIMILKLCKKDVAYKGGKFPSYFCYVGDVVNNHFIERKDSNNQDKSFKFKLIGDLKGTETKLTYPLVIDIDNIENYYITYDKKTDDKGNKTYRLDKNGNKTFIILIKKYKVVELENNSLTEEDLF